jgi:hypothetical protein
VILSTTLALELQSKTPAGREVCVCVAVRCVSVANCLVEDAQGCRCRTTRDGVQA